MRPQPAQVLLIDDRPEIESALAACLRKDMIQITGVRDGPAGIGLATEKRFDLILLDLEMPEMDGFEVLQRLKSADITKPVPVIMLTGYDTLPDKVRSFELGASDYIVKPFHSAELRARIRAVLRTQQLNTLLSQAETELSGAQNALEEALIAKDRLIGVVNDSLRAPLAGNQALAGVLLQCGLNEQQRDLVQTIMVNSQSTVEVLEDIVDFVSLQNGQMRLEAQPFDLRTCVEEAFASLAAKADEKGLDLAYLWPEGLPSRVVGDGKRIRQIIIHLASNAVRCTFQGEVVLRVELAGAPGMVSPGASSPPSSAQYFHFQLSDTGVGIAEEKLRDLFTPFAADPARGARKAISSGLGLAICHGLAALQGGAIWAESALGQGATFHFTLCLPPAAAPLAAGGVSLASGIAGLDLLVADGSEAVRQALCQQARALGLAAAAAASRQEVLDYLGQGRSCDLLVLDARLPEGGGMALSQEVRALGLAKPPGVILLTRHGQVLSLESLSEGSIAATLRKPTRLAALREAVTHAIEGTHFTEEPPRAAVLDPTLASRMPARILVVDGDAMTRTILISILRGYGYCPETARNGAEARQSLAGEEPLGIVFLDTDMGDFDALEATRQLRLRERERSRRRPEIPPSILVAMNESDQEEVRRKSLAVGMDDYLAKPPTVETVLNIVENWASLVPSQPPIPPPGPEPAGAGRAEAGKAAMPPGATVKLTMAAEAPFALDATAEAVVSLAPGDSLADVPGPVAGSGAPELNPPVDFKLLLESANGDWNGLFELIDLYLDQTEHRFEQLITAISLGNAPEIEALARSGAGASAACGVTNLIKPLRDLQNLARAGDLERAELACAEAIQEYERLRAFLDRQRKLHLKPPA